MPDKPDFFQKLFNKTKENLQKKTTAVKQVPASYKPSPAATTPTMGEVGRWRPDGALQTAPPPIAERRGWYGKRVPAPSGWGRLLFWSAWVG